MQETKSRTSERRKEQNIMTFDLNEFMKQQKSKPSQPALRRNDYSSFQFGIDNAAGSIPTSGARFDLLKEGYGRELYGLSKYIRIADEDVNKAVPTRSHNKAHGGRSMRKAYQNSKSKSAVGGTTDLIKASFGMEGKDMCHTVPTATTGWKANGEPNRL